MNENGVDELGIAFEPDAIRRIIREYTYEAGVRNLEREIGRVCRKIARMKAEGKEISHDRHRRIDREIPRSAAGLSNGSRTQR